MGFLSRAVQPPSNVYVESSDQLVIACATSQRNEQLTVNYRLLRFDGVLLHGQFVMQPVSTRALLIHNEPLAEGFLLSVSCKAAIATTRGQTFVRAFLTKPSLGAGQPSYMLMSDYVTTAMAPAHPNGRQLAPSEGPGYINTVSLGNPAAGLDWAFIVPANTRWRPICLIAALETNAAAPVRIVQLNWSGGAANCYFSCAAASQGPSIVVQYPAAGIQPATPINPLVNPLVFPPGIFMTTAGGVSSNTGNLSAGDQWVNIAMQVEEWLDNV